MGQRDYFKHGAYNCVCMVCGRKRKNDEMKMRWDGLFVCKDDWEPRQPQDFVRGVEDIQQPETTSPEHTPDILINPGTIKPSDL